MVLISEWDVVVPPSMGREIFGMLRVSGDWDIEEGGGGVFGGTGTGRTRKPLGRLVVLEGA